MVRAIVNDRDCSPKAARLTFEAFHPPVKCIAENQPLMPKEGKTFDEKIYSAAREGRMAESTKNKILKAALMITIGSVIVITVALMVLFPAFWGISLVGMVLSVPVIMEGLSKAYEKFLGFPRDSDTPKKETIKAKDSIINCGIFKDSHLQLDKILVSNDRVYPNDCNTKSHKRPAASIGSP